MKLKLSVFAALIVGGISALAVTAPVVLPAGTNSSPEATMKALFGDPAIVKSRTAKVAMNMLRLHLIEG